MALIFTSTMEWTQREVATVPVDLEGGQPGL